MTRHFIIGFVFGVFPLGLERWGVTEWRAAASWGMVAAVLVVVVTSSKNWIDVGARLARIFTLVFGWSLGDMGVHFGTRQTDRDPAFAFWSTFMIMMPVAWVLSATVAFLFEELNSQKGRRDGGDGSIE